MSALGRKQPFANVRKRPFPDMRIVAEYETMSTLLEALEADADSGDYADQAASADRSNRLECDFRNWGISSTEYKRRETRRARGIGQSFFI